MSFNIYLLIIIFVKKLIRKQLAKKIIKRQKIDRYQAYIQIVRDFILYIVRIVIRAILNQILDNGNVSQLSASSDDPFSLKTVRGVVLSMNLSLCKIDR